MEKSQLTGASLVLLIAGLGGSLPAWADGSTTVGGKIYTDITNISSTPKSSGDGFGVDVKRFYFGADHTFDDQWSANITTDFTHGSAGEKTQVFVKKAYFQYKISDTATLRMGSADMPWIPYAEHAYGFRYVEPTLVDKFEKGSTSADWGLHLMGKTDMVDYQVSLVNGSGYASLNRSKSMDISARLGLHPVQGLTLAIGGRSGKHGSEL
ncbi:MAG TPA: porin, partial [Pseudomonadales bacterium]|nr:porin [Pseudomonadales bacterium]